MERVWEASQCGWKNQKRGPLQWLSERSTWIHCTPRHSNLQVVCGDLMTYQASCITINTTRLLLLYTDLIVMSVLKYWAVLKRHRCPLLLQQSLVKRFTKNMAPINFNCTFCSSYLSCTVCSQSEFQVGFFKYIQQTSCKGELPLKRIKVASAGRFREHLACSLPSDPQPP